jgi:kynureninase
MSPATDHRLDESYARALDERDALRHTRDLFVIPTVRDITRGQTPSDEPCAYFVGNSLGLMPKATPAAIQQELDDWSRLAVEAHFEGATPWFSYHEVFREMGARLVGAVPGEVVMMNSLTVNLHLLMVSFYRPTPHRYKIIIEDGAFPSDSYAVASQAAFHGFDPAEAVVRLKPREGEQTLRTEDVIDAIGFHGSSTALVMLGGVNYRTGQWFDMEAITRAGHEVGAVVGWDLAHAAGSVPMRLHDWNVDFAAWCSYKYLNAGPGAVAGAFVHERHGRDFSLPRFAGWWGNDPATRFKMGPDFVPRQGADGWQLSNPPILAMAPLKVSLEIFDRVGMEALRDKSLRLTGYLEYLLDQLPAGSVEILTPRTAADRGGHLSIAVRGHGKELTGKLRARGVICDFREPNVIRVAPVPLYVTFHDVWRFAEALKSIVARG